MLGALFGALASVTHGISKTVEDVGQRIGAPQWLTAGLSGAFEMAGNSFNAGKDIELPSFGGGMAFAQNAKSFLGGMLGESSPAHMEITQKLGGNALKQEILSKMPVDNSIYASNQNQVQAPSTPMEAALQSYSRQA